MGEATALMAAADPRPLLAVEVHPAGIVALLRGLDAAQLDHVRVVDGDAVEVLTACREQALEQVRLFFPDPWPKSRHAKRRLLRPAFADLLASRLAPEGFLHLATDSLAYVEHARESFAGWDIQAVPRPASRPVTGYERRAHAAGREVTDLVCRPRAY